jgi:tetratricopeptide (TPR) repeat protein
MMRYVPSDKYTIAWFKLAECVAKGEKEKAFGVYRLLMHSFDDQAYAYQLEGDLLDAFQDSRAIEKYTHAAHLYVKNNKLREAAAIYRELLFMQPAEIMYIQRLIEIYNKASNKELTLKKVTTLVDMLCQKRMYNHVRHIVERFEAETLALELGRLYQKVALYCIKADDSDFVAKEHLFESIVSFYIESTKSQQLQEFLFILKETDDYWYNKAAVLLKY